MEHDFKIAVIGLGLIGGSMAYALRGFRNGRITGCDINPEIRAQALRERAVEQVFDNPGDAIEDADLVILCTYPDRIPGLASENRDRFKPGAVVTDVCGVKTGVARSLRGVLPKDVDYVGGHPMAGKEVEGFENASPELFWMTGFIITPVEGSKQESIDLIYEMAHYIGATRITLAAPEEHDAVIAYTSDLMHVAAAGLCLDFHPQMNPRLYGGVFPGLHPDRGDQSGALDRTVFVQCGAYRRGDRPVSAKSRTSASGHCGQGRRRPAGIAVRSTRK